MNYTHLTHIEQNGEHWLVPVNPNPPTLLYSGGGQVENTNYTHWNREHATTRYLLLNPSELNGRDVIPVGEVEFKGWEYFAKFVYGSQKWLPVNSNVTEEQMKLFSVPFRQVCEIIKPKEEKPDFSPEYDMGYYGWTNEPTTPLQAAEGEETYTMYEVNFINFQVNDGDYMLCKSMAEVTRLLETECDHILDSKPEDLQYPYSVSIKPKAMTINQYNKLTSEYYGN